MPRKSKVIYLRFLPPTQEFPFGTIEVDDERVYALAADLKGQEEGISRIVWEFSGFDVVNRCSTCGRSDTMPRKVEGPTLVDVIEQAVERRLLVAVAEVRSRRGP